METTPAARPVNTSRVFWGTLWIVAGILILLAKLDVLTLEVGSLWKFWPLVFVLWGISILTGAKVIRALLAVCGAVLIALMLYGMWQEWGPERTARETSTQVFREMYDAPLRHASLRIVSGAGTFTIRDTCADLFKAEATTNFGKYEIENQVGDDRRDLTLRLAEHHMSFHPGGKNNVTMSLNPGPVWAVVLELGAAKVDADLSPFEAGDVTIKTGASDVHLKLGDRAEESRVTIHAGASSIQVRVPESAGCEIRSESGLTGKSFEGFTEGSDGRYRTSNFEGASKKIFLDFKAGVSSLVVHRY